MTISPARDLRTRWRGRGLHARGWRLLSIKAWTGLGPIRSLRGGLLLMTILAVTPLVLFASGMALLRANDAHRLPTAAAWITVAAVPILIGLASVIIVRLAAQAMVMEWLLYLERLSRAYTRGRYSLRPRRLLHAPLEFRSVGAAVEEMAAAVEHRDHALREALHEQTLLLREVHHRVKNNLQIVGSLLSLQAARTKDPDTRAALQDALVRIDAMSLSQRFMPRQEEPDNVSSLELFGSFAAQVRARLGGARPGGGRRALVLGTDIEPQIMPLEVAARLASIAAEALICAVRSAGTTPLTCTLSVGFDADTVRLRIAVSDEPDPFVCGPGEVSRDLIDGYVRQMHGRLDMTAEGGALTVTAPCPLPRHLREASASPPGDAGPEILSPFGSNPSPLGELTQAGQQRRR
jgi:two-component sensor histidine kinase